MIKAKSNPGANYDWEKDTKEVAAAYGLTIKELAKAAIEFAHCEGYDTFGNEHEDLHEWLTRGLNETMVAPYQKGD